VDALARLLDLSREEKIERGPVITRLRKLHSSPPPGSRHSPSFQKYRARLAEFLGTPGSATPPLRNQLLFSSALALPTTWAEL